MMPRMIMTESGAYPVPPCPAWCELPADHDLDNPSAHEYDGSVNRRHTTVPQVIETDYHPIEIEVSQVTEIGPEAMNEERACICLSANIDTIDAALARRLAAALLDAAERLDEIVGC